ncbi:DUF6571 family protein [Embleya sp. NPDC005971]|uniref:DUF6571 family protein n=1 Tax=Embleya sp. NPDC005971 TaxID=3156724 RepID=UPI0034075E60
MVDFIHLRDVDLGTLTTAAEVWATLPDRMHTQHGDVDREVISPLAGGAWKGSEANTGIGELRTMSGQIEDAHTEAAALRTVLLDAASDLKTAKEHLTKAIADAVDQKLTVDDSGGVHWTAPPYARNLPPDDYDAAVKPLKEAAQGISDRIGKALTEATAADQRAAFALNADTRGADPKKFNGNAVGAGPAQDARRATDLANRLMMLSPAERGELRNLLAANADDPAFSTPFLNQQGPRGTLWLAGMIAKLGAGSDVPKDQQEDLKAIQADLGRVLAAGTGKGPGPHVDQNWIDELKRAGREKTDIGLYSFQPYGYQLLGTLLDTGHQDTDFLRQIGQDMRAMERDDPAVWLKNTPSGAMYNGFRLDITDGHGAGLDPMTGLMAAFGNNPEAAKEFFDPAKHPGEVAYMLKDRHWLMDWDGAGPIPEGYNPPGYDELGRALEAAATGQVPTGGYGLPGGAHPVHDETMKQIMRDTVSVLGGEDGKQGKFPAIMRDSVGNMVASYMGDGVYDQLVAKDGQNGSMFHDQDLMRVITAAGTDPEAFAVMHGATVNHAADVLAQHPVVKVPGALPAMDVEARQAFNALGTMDGLRDESIVAAREAGVTEATWNRKFQYLTSAQILSYIPHVGIPAGRMMDWYTAHALAADTAGLEHGSGLSRTENYWSGWSSSKAMAEEYARANNASPEEIADLAEDRRSNAMDVAPRRLGRK